MTRRNPDRYTVQDWKFAGPTVGAIIANRWLVYTECELCELRIRADLKRIARERGANYVLWGGLRPAAGWAARAGSPSGCGRMGRAGMWR